GVYPTDECGQFASVIVCDGVPVRNGGVRTALAVSGEAIAANRTRVVGRHGIGLVWTRTGLVRISNRGLIGGHRALHFFVLPHEPVGGPDAMESPTEVFQLLLTQPISIPRRWARVICRAVAFDREHEPPWLVRVLGDQVDPETRCSHLRYQWNPIGLERVEHLGLELVQRQTSGLDVSEELSVGGR